MAKEKRPQRSAGRVSVVAQQGSRRKQKNLLFYGMAAVAGVAVIAAIVVGITLGSGGGTGDPAPDFNFSLYQGFGEIGERHSNLSRLQGQPVVLNFWAELCPPCRAEMPQFQVFYEEFKDRVTLLGIDVGRLPVWDHMKTPTNCCRSWASPTRPVGPTTAA